jgi:BioD-like phosphotransacetylase family protein
MKKLFVAATRQDDGKSTLCLGLLQALRKRITQVGFMKPVGQHYVKRDGYEIDEDVVLMKDVCQIEDNLVDMNPIVVKRGFTEEYIERGDINQLAQKIQTSFDRISRGKELILIEGTGHAGVGAVIDLCNASVAKLLEAKVLLLSVGGIGRPIDEITINKALFDQKGVEVLGVVINKVLSEKYDKIRRITQKSLTNKGINLLGVMPFEKRLTYPTMRQIQEACGASIFCGEKYLEKKVFNILVGAMEPYHALEYILPHSLVIVPGDREDIILAIIAGSKLEIEDGFEISGMVLTGGLKPHQGILKLVKNCDFPVLLSTDDTYNTARKVDERRVKIRSCDKDKIKEAERLVTRYVDLDKLMQHISE